MAPADQGLFFAVARIGHELARIGETFEVAEFRDQGDGGDQRNTVQGLN